MKELNVTMDSKYTDTAKLLKVLAEPKRLKIVDMLSCGELCACKILEEFKITQPTLSHDMKRLVDAGLVFDRREGKNVYYSLNSDRLYAISELLSDIFSSNEECICHDGAE